jgi:hypothetical protein
MTKRNPRYDVAFYAPAMGPLLTDVGDSAAGGAETQVDLLARALARHGARVASVLGLNGTRRVADTPFAEVA